MMRAKLCAQCGGPLPEGGRIDRRYCREACRVMAYRERRRPDPLAPTTGVEGSRPTGRPPATASSEQALNLRTELTAALARIDELEAQGRALRRQANALEQQLASLQARLEAVEVAQRHAPVAGSTETEQADRLPKVTPTTTVNDPPPPPPIPDTAPSTLAAERQEERHQPGTLTKLAPETLAALLRKLTTAITDELLPLLVQKGATTEARQLLHWQRAAMPMLRRLILAIISQAVSTPESQRQTDAEVRELAQRAVAGLPRPNALEGACDPTLTAQFLVEGGRLPLIITAFLVHRIPDEM